MTRDGKADCRSRLYISPAGSVGVSALQRCPPDTRTLAMTREEIAAHLTALAMTKRKDCRAPCGACNDKERMNRRGIKGPQIKKAKYDLKIDYI